MEDYLVRVQLKIYYNLGIFMKCNRFNTRYQGIQLTLELIYFTIRFRFYCLQNYFNVIYLI